MPVPDIALPHSKALPARREATAQLRRLTLSGRSIRRKRHESVMSSVRDLTVTIGTCF